MANIELKTTDAKCDAKVTSAIRTKVKEMAKTEGWNLEGNQDHFKKIERIFNVILAGGKIKELKSEYQEFVPGCLSQTGSWMPRTALESIGGIVEADIMTVKVAKGEYEEYSEWQMENDFAEPDKKDMRVGVEAVCMRCHSTYITPEPCLQPRCPKCNDEVGKKKGGKGKGSNRVAMMKPLKRYEEAYKTEKDANKKAQILIGINNLRRKLGMDEMKATPAPKK